MEKQIRVVLTLTKEEERAIIAAYSRYLLGEDEQLSRNKWIKRIIMESIENETE